MLLEAPRRLEVATSSRISVPRASFLGGRVGAAAPLAHPAGEPQRGGEGGDDGAARRPGAAAAGRGHGHGEWRPEGPALDAPEGRRGDRRGVWLCAQLGSWPVSSKK